MDEKLEIEQKIAELEKEVKYAIFPVTRDDYKDKPEPAKMYLRFLQSIKSLKDSNSSAWTKMQSWD